MLIEFSGEKTGSVVMFGSVASQLMRMMGLSGNSEGALNAEDVPEALEKLKAALSSVPESNNTEDEDGETAISIHTRAVPLIDLLEESVAERGYVMWKQKK